MISALKFSFLTITRSPVYYQPSRDSKFAVIFSLSLRLWATLGENCLVIMQRDCNLEKIKGENCEGMDFKMGVAATLPELSEWTLHSSAPPPPIID